MWIIDTRIASREKVWKFVRLNGSRYAVPDPITVSRYLKRHAASLLPTIAGIDREERARKMVSIQFPEPFEGTASVRREERLHSRVEIWKPATTKTRQCAKVLHRCTKVVNFCSVKSWQRMSASISGRVEARWTVKYWILTQLHRTRYISKCKYADA